jgi:putative inorganic carbon (HCO3(-)) transporter
VGGGFEFQSPQTSAIYSPRPEFFHVAHSIYFQVLGSLGFPGLLLFLLFWGLVWREAGRLRTRSRGDPESQWAHALGSMVQASLTGYFIGGAFLDIAFWDLNYYLFTAIVGAHYTLDRIARGSSSQSELAGGVPSGPTASLAQTQSR